MTILLNAAPVTIIVGHSENAALTLPQGAKTLNVNYSNVGWPAVSDGQIKVSLFVSNNNGVSYPAVPDWADTFEHIALSKGGVPQTSANAGATLQAPFGSTSKLKVVFDNSTPVVIATTVTVTAA
jgi:hypothetical protein